MRFHHSIKHSSIAVVALLTLAALSLGGLSACGNKGPLYIPAPPIEQQPAMLEPQDTSQDISQDSEANQTSVEPSE